MKIRVSICVLVVLLIYAQVVPAQEQADFRAVLVARENAIKSFQADLVVVWSPGDERNEAADARLHIADWMDKSRPGKSPKGLRQSIEEYRAMPTNEEHFRYLVNAKGQTRLEQVPVPSLGGAYNRADRLYVHVYTGDEWKSYLEATDDSTNQRVGSLNVDKQRVDQTSYEVARGIGLPISSLALSDSKDHQLSRRATSLGAIGWSELFRILSPKQYRVEMSTPPGGKDPLPVLVMETQPFRDTGLWGSRVEAWFAPEHGYALRALRTSKLRTAGVPEKWELLPTSTVEWSEPIDLEEGIPFYQKCRMCFMDLILVPDDSQPDSVWASRGYDRSHADFQFSDVHVNKPLEDALFEVHPIAGTNVIDEPKGYLYVVGNAGEELQKTALAERGRRPPEERWFKSSANPWRTILLIVNILALLALTAYWFFVRKHQSEKKQ